MEDRPLSNKNKTRIILSNSREYETGAEDPPTEKTPVKEIKGVKGLVWEVT